MECLTRLGTREHVPVANNILHMAGTKCDLVMRESAGDWHLKGRRSTSVGGPTLTRAKSRPVDSRAV